MVYGPDPSLGFGPLEQECLEVSEEIIVADAHSYAEQLENCPKDQGVELIEVIL